MLSTVVVGRRVCWQIRRRAWGQAAEDERHCVIPAVAHNAPVNAFSAGQCRGWNARKL